MTCLSRRPRHCVVEGGHPQGQSPQRRRRRRRRQGRGCQGEWLHIWLLVCWVLSLEECIVDSRKFRGAVAGGTDNGDAATTTTAPAGQDESPKKEEQAHPRLPENGLKVHLYNKYMSRLDFTSPQMGTNLTTVPDEESTSAATLAALVTNRLWYTAEERLTKLFEKAHSAECRALIGEHFGYFMNALGREVGLPFQEIDIVDECPEDKYDFDDLPDGITLGQLQNRVYKPPPDQAEYIDHYSNLNLCFGILTHNHPEATIRLVEALEDDGHSFVIHVDGKESADETWRHLQEYASTRPHVHILTERVRVNWGGFTMVNATLQILDYVFDAQLDFHKFVHLASTSYPLRSKTFIRRLLSEYPLDANMMHVIMKPTNPGHHAWHYFVECDDALHRIYRLPPLRGHTEGIDIYTSSQWFIISREFALYIAQNDPSTMVYQYREYAQHVVVADEAFFGTVLRHSPYCTKHHNNNLLHVQFDRWESEVETEKRDERKCMMPDPNHCGRSPTTMTVDYMPVLELSGALFARKFLDSVDSEIKDVIDEFRQREEEQLSKYAETGQWPTDEDRFDPAFEGHGVLIVARETMNDAMPLCLGLGPSGNKARLTPCFHDFVVDTLAEGWEYGAVIVEETLEHNRWELGPCSTDGNLERLDNGDMKVYAGIHSPTGPRCNLHQKDGLRHGRCLDAEADDARRGTELQVYPCNRRWHQFFAFGSKENSTTIFTKMPLHVHNRLEELNPNAPVATDLCIAVAGRTRVPDEEEEEEAWVPKTENKSEEEEAEESPFFPDTPSNEELRPWHDWSGKRLITTPCTDVDAVLEWALIPYIVEDEEEDGAGSEDEEEWEQEEEDEEWEEGGDDTVEVKP